MVVVLLERSGRKVPSLGRWRDTTSAAPNHIATSSSGTNSRAKQAQGGQIKRQRE